MDHLGYLQADSARMGELAATHSLEERVPHCADWNAEDLIRHTGSVHRWATHIVRGGGPRVARDLGPESADDVPDWFRSGAEELQRVLRETDPQTPCWTIDRDTPVAAYWHRRQALETVIHRVDLERAFGITPIIDQALALDGIDEVVSCLYPRQVSAGRCDRIDAIRLRATNAGQEWVIGDGDPVGTVEGPAAAVFLALWHRIDGTDPALSVSDAAADSLAAALTP